MPGLINKDEESGQFGDEWGKKVFGVWKLIKVEALFLEKVIVFDTLPRLAS